VDKKDVTLFDTEKGVEYYMDNLAGRNYMDMCNLLTEVKLNTSFRKFYFPGDGCGIGSLAARKVFGEGNFQAYSYDISERMRVLAKKLGVVVFDEPASPQDDVLEVMSFCIGYINPTHVNVIVLDVLQQFSEKHTFRGGGGVYFRGFFDEFPVELTFSYHDVVIQPTPFYGSNIFVCQESTRSRAEMTPEATVVQRPEDADVLFYDPNYPLNVMFKEDVPIYIPRLCQFLYVPGLAELMLPDVVEVGCERMYFLTKSAVCNESKQVIICGKKMVFCSVKMKLGQKMLFAFGGRVVTFYCVGMDSNDRLGFRYKRKKLSQKTYKSYKFGPFDHRHNIKCRCNVVREENGLPVEIVLRNGYDDDALSYMLGQNDPKLNRLRFNCFTPILNINLNLQ
jgi:hypothetical protein